MLWGGEAVVAAGRVVSRVRSGGYGHTLGHNVALAYLPAELARPGTAVSVESFGRLVPAEVRTAPLWDPRGERVAGLTILRSTGEDGSASGGSTTPCPMAGASRSTRCACLPWPTSCRSSTTAGSC